MKTKKIYLAAFVALCATAATTVFTACGDNDPEITVYKSYQYQMVHNYSLNLDAAEKEQILAELNKALGNTSSTQKVYGDNVDEDMKARCKAVMDKYTNVKTFYWSLSLQRKSNFDFDYQTIDTYIIGYSQKGTYVLLTNYTVQAIYSSANGIRDSLYSKKTAADSAYFKALVKTQNQSFKDIKAHYELNLKDWENKILNQDYMNALNRICDTIKLDHSRDSLIEDVVVTLNCETFVPVRQARIFRQDTIKATIK